MLCATLAEGQWSIPSSATSILLSVQDQSMCWHLSSKGGRFLPLTRVRTQISVPAASQNVPSTCAAQCAWVICMTLLWAPWCLAVPRAVRWPANPPALASGLTQCCTLRIFRSLGSAHTGSHSSNMAVQGETLYTGASPPVQVES